MMAAHEVERVYLALVWGHLDAPRGVIDAPIGRSIRRPTRMSVREGGRSARTTYVVLTEYAEPVVSLLECTLETGRTHQIRVHLQAVGHPVVGDASYGGARPALDLRRPFLHATAVAFAHPVTGERVVVEEPLPPELAECSRVSRDASSRSSRRTWPRQLSITSGWPTRVRSTRSANVNRS